MPRPKVVSDEAVLEAALGLMAAKGMAFTLSDVAGAVGLSRAALIQRFGNREALLVHMARQEVVTTRDWLGGLAVEPGPEGLWRFLVEIVESMGAGEGFSARVTLAALEASDPELRALAAERYALVQAAIAARAGDHPDPDGLAAHLHAVIAGATMQWVASAEGGLSDFVLARLRWAMAAQFPGS